MYQNVAGCGLGGGPFTRAPELSPNGDPLSALKSPPPSKAIERKVFRNALFKPGVGPTRGRLSPRETGLIVKSLWSEMLSYFEAGAGFALETRAPWEAVNAGRGLVPPRASPAGSGRQSAAAWTRWGLQRSLDSERGKEIQTKNKAALFMA